MYLKKLIIGITSSLFLFNLAIADSSTSYTIDISELNDTGTVSGSTTYKTNSTIIGFVDGNYGYSTNYILGSGLPYLELWCGNGILELGETCDDGNTIASDGCSSTCQTEGAIACGNGILEAGEQCDDGNLVPGDGCSAICTLEAVCGNGTKETGEQCDDGNLTNGDGCSSTCSIEVPPGGGGGGGVIKFLCGNGNKDAGEQCDDGNNKDGDGCNSICFTEETGKRTFKIKARPEKRVNPTQNWGTSANLTFYSKDTNTIIHTAQITINDTGWGILQTNNVPAGTYNISLKALSHLTKVMRNVVISDGEQLLDFTFGETFYLLAGDVHSSKDDFVNALDITSAVKALYTSDIHADLNKDGFINSLDITIAVNNIYKNGESF